MAAFRPLYSRAGLKAAVEHCGVGGFVSHPYLSQISAPVLLLMNDDTQVVLGRQL